MRVSGRSVGARVLGMPRRPLVVCLLAVLLFELSLLAGVLAAPFFQEWLPRRSLPMDETTAMLVRYRRSVFRRELDPRVGGTTGFSRLSGQEGSAPLRPGRQRLNPESPGGSLVQADQQRSRPPPPRGAPGAGPEGSDLRPAEQPCLGAARPARRDGPAL